MYPVKFPLFVKHLEFQLLILRPRHYEEINEVSKYNYVVVNDDLDVAAKKVEAILISEFPNTGDNRQTNLMKIEEIKD